jgi:demethylmenaquinone methyltransferase / 2-methoxy-6-polyprenyl-1,4-benzoquinol methylase
MDRQDSNRFKERAIREMFTRIAPYYDIINRLMSWGQDSRWRRVAVSLACPGRGRVLDVATGTGDIALELARHTGSVVGLDLCQEMLSRGRIKMEKRGLRRSVDFIVGDALALPFSDNSFDCALNGFALRNVADINLFLAELRRVVKPGGRVVCLELVRPASGMIGTFYRFYLNRIVPVLGRWLSGDGKAYRYLPDSVGCFLSVAEFQKMMEEVGFRQVGHRSLNLGTIAVHVGVK